MSRGQHSQNRSKAISITISICVKYESLLCQKWKTFTVDDYFKHTQISKTVVMFTLIFFFQLTRQSMLTYYHFIEPPALASRMRSSVFNLSGGSNNFRVDPVSWIGKLHEIQCTKTLSEENFFIFGQINISLERDFKITFFWSYFCTTACYATSHSCLGRVHKPFCLKNFVVTVQKTLFLNCIMIGELAFSCNWQNVELKVLCLTKNNHYLFFTRFIKHFIKYQEQLMWNF